ncbi:hypothetical protein N9Y00_03785 [Tateyamaria sp.]|nr:hypothetical protein [Tateyamaria sp.]
MRTEKRPMESFVLSEKDAPYSLEEAYNSIAAELKRVGWPIGGWKVGGSNHATCATFDVQTPYYGALLTEEIMSATKAAPCPGYPMVEWKGEVEFALRISADGRGYDGWCLALEMPSSPLGNLPGVGVAALVADRCGAGALLLGKIHDGKLPELEGKKLVLEADGVQLDEADSSALTAAPEEILAEVLDLLRQHGHTPEAGQWVATGGVTGCHQLSRAGQLRVTFDGIDMLNAVLSDGL